MRAPKATDCRSEALPQHDWPCAVLIYYFAWRTLKSVLDRGLAGPARLPWSQQPGQGLSLGSCQQVNPVSKVKDLWCRRLKTGGESASGPALHLLQAADWLQSTDLTRCYCSSAAQAIALAGPLDLLTHCAFISHTSTSRRYLIQPWGHAPSNILPLESSRPVLLCVYVFGTSRQKLWLPLTQLEWRSGVRPAFDRPGRVSIGLQVCLHRA